jgi:hypothetical protein
MLTTLAERPHCTVVYDIVMRGDANRLSELGRKSNKRKRTSASEECYTSLVVAILRIDGNVTVVAIGQDTGTHV